MIEFDVKSKILNVGERKGQTVYYAQPKMQQRMPVEEVFKKDTGYYGWMMQGDFPQNTKNVITAIKLRTKA